MNSEKAAVQPLRVVEERGWVLEVRWEAQEVEEESRAQSESLDEERLVEEEVQQTTEEEKWRAVGAIMAVVVVVVVTWQAR